MSEYQYYEFQAVDKPLTTSEQTYISKLSSRVQLTSRSAIFTYSYGDFRGEPKELLEKCFDVMLYVANWGTRQLVFRLPKSVIDSSVFEPYCLPEQITVSTNSSYIILDINLDDEEYRTWIEGEGWLTRLLQIRDDILQGDFRALYLAWLKATSISIYEEQEELLEPPVPANLNQLPIYLEAFIEFFDIDRDLIAFATGESVSQQDEVEPIEEWIRTLSSEEKNEFLLKVMRDEPNVKLQLIKRLRAIFKNPKNSGNDKITRRSLAELLTGAQEQNERRNKQEFLRAQQEKIRKLEALALKKDKVWLEVYKLIELKQSKPYEQAVAYLIDLRDLAEYQGSLEEFKASIQKIQKDYSSRSGLLSRLKKSGLFAV
ncbi:hypothetical protein [Calothrix sp. NIES-2098]|uniref:hypothetical protein n=1 Tax=Calothrix sp. NIES-2098 TaxID=1954171 RepID=UPI000B604C8E|nr:hypothetical protein NIES2098_72700 [Calothrix sp. NIES-2098]